MDNIQHDASVYLASIDAALPRVFSMLDREAISKTYGCADRLFWSWKFTDFPGARLQEIAYVLAELAVTPTLLPGRAFTQETLLSWAKAAIAFWSTLQHKDGSFDEAYPFERSLAATAFTGFYVGRAFLAIRHYYSPEEQSGLVHVFRRAGEWLSRNDERHGVLSNHLAVAAAALHTIAEITSEEKFTERQRYFVGRILQRQSSEGWYEEYGGADPGYQTHTTFYLGYLWARTRDEALLESLRRSLRYFWHFVHLDGSIGGEYGSRNTRFFMPAGFEILAEAIPEAAVVARFMRQSLAAQRVVALPAMDPQNVFPLLNNYVFVLRFAKPLEDMPLPALPCQSYGVKRFVQSGHVVISTPEYQAIIGAAKGGVIAAFARNAQATEPIWMDSGVAVTFGQAKRASSQGLNCSRVHDAGDASLTIESRFTEINQTVMSPLTFVGFRVTNFISVVFPSFAYYLKNLLVRTLVRRKKPCPIRLLRSITWDSQRISLKDEVILDRPCRVTQLWQGGRFSAVHMGSSRYFEWQELSHPVLANPLPAEDIRRLNETGTLIIHREWRI